MLCGSCKLPVCGVLLMGCCAVFWLLNVCCLLWAGYCLLREVCCVLFGVVDVFAVCCALADLRGAMCVV